MPGISISKDLKDRLAADERAGLEDFLWKKSGEKCWLCDETLNRAADTVEADHEVPVAEGGPEKRDNLNLVHRSCNRAKRNSPSVDVRPYLRIASFLRQHDFPRYDGCIDFFAIKPKQTVLTMSGDSAKFEFPDGSITRSPIFKETNPAATFSYVFADIPRNAIFNDDECQPRAIKLPQLWAIYQDIQRNPLHEPPSCRLMPGTKKEQVRLAMFDGQHKTLAVWMSGRDRVVAKIYLDLDKDGAIHLVNSIQAKIKKLPLSPFELAGKLADEWSGKLSRYADEVGSETVSEAGFFKWLPVAERTRGKQAFQAAIVQELLSSTDLQLLKYVQLAGRDKNENALITETVFRTKLLEPLLYLKPLDEIALDGEVLRSRERENVVQALNYVGELAFEPQGATGELTPNQKEIRRRLLYQSSLSYISHIIRALFGHVLAVDNARSLIEKTPTEAQWTRIKEGIRRLIEHPVWTAGLNLSPRMRAIESALSKNQDAQKAFGDVGLKLGYVVGADKLNADWDEA